MLLRPFCFFGSLLISVGTQSADLISAYEEAVTTNPQLAAAAANLELEVNDVLDAVKSGP